MRNVKQWVAALLLIALSLTNCLVVSAESRPATAPTDRLSVGAVETAPTESVEQETATQPESTEKADKTTTPRSMRRCLRLVQRIPL